MSEVGFALLGLFVGLAAVAVWQSGRPTQRGHMLRLCSWGLAVALAVAIGNPPRAFLVSLACAGAIAAELLLHRGQFIAALRSCAAGLTALLAGAFLQRSTSDLIVHALAFALLAGLGYLWHLYTLRRAETARLEATVLMTLLLLWLHRASMNVIPLLDDRGASTLLNAPALELAAAIMLNLAAAMGGVSVFNLDGVDPDTERLLVAMQAVAVACMLGSVL
jgi:hypothetical protein